MKRFNGFLKIAIPIILLISIGLITYLPFSSRLGVYHDSWYIVMAKYLNKDMRSLFLSDRPAIGINFSILSKIFLLDFRAWFLYALTIRILTAILFFIILKIIFPKNNVECLFAGILFLTYPGFLEQYDAGTYQTLLMALLLFLLSVWLMLRAFIAKSWKTKLPLIVFSVCFQIIYLSLVEYLIGLEGLRLLIIYFHARKQEDKPFVWKQLFIAAIPYLAGAFIFLFWRFGIFHSTISKSQIPNPKSQIRRLAPRAGRRRDRVSVVSAVGDAQRRAAGRGGRAAGTAAGGGNRGRSAGLDSGRPDAGLAARRRGRGVAGRFAGVRGHRGAGRRRDVLAAALLGPSRPGVADVPWLGSLGGAGRGDCPGRGVLRHGL